MEIGSQLPESRRNGRNWVGEGMLPVRAFILLAHIVDNRVGVQ